MQGRGVGGGVDHEDDGVEAPARHVVGVALAGAVGRVVVGGEDEPGADRVAGVVHGEDGRAGGGGVADVVPGLLQGGAEAQRGVHQLLEAEDENAAGAGTAPQRLPHPGRQGRQGRLQAFPVLRREAVAAAVGQVPGPVEDGPYEGGGQGYGLRLPYRPVARLVLRHEGPALLQDPFREAHGAGRAGDQVDAGTDLLREGVQAVAVGGRAHVHEGDDDVPLARVAFVQVADGVEDGVAGGELVVHQHQGAVAGEQLRVLG